MPSSSSFIVIFVCVFAMVNGNVSNTPYGTISFFSSKSFKGFSYSDNYTPGCHEIQPYFRENIGSVNSDRKCLRVYRSKWCEGSYSRIDEGTPNHWDLSRVEWDSGTGHLHNTIKAWKPCID